MQPLKVAPGNRTAEIEVIFFSSLTLRFDSSKFKNLAIPP